ncbi:hypothetical protein PsorP6_002299 [Peronosclerospora sorghi]|uniref:Uncharacterized protein n=1 Tax=Peronosclerospora sorghi TaxID=230839 RepID=A0ACC0WZH9_9STRA|nr:hypothetical protein PsorP6_002299 [Peronosclerospora sorghi]
MNVFPTVLGDGAASWSWKGEDAWDILCCAPCLSSITTIFLVTMPRSFNTSMIPIHSCNPVAIAIYSASVDDKVTVTFFFEPHSTSFPSYIEDDKSCGRFAISFNRKRCITTDNHTIVIGTITNHQAMFFR